MRAAAVLWFGWLAFAIGISWRAFRWEIDYFHSPGPQFFRIVVVLISVSPVLLAVWHFIRSRGILKYEFILLAGLPAVACFVYEARAALVVTFATFACFGAGRKLRTLLQIEPAGPVEDIAISAGIGLGALHCALFAIGLLHGYYPVVFAVLLGSATVACRREIPSLFQALRKMNSAWRAMPEAARWPGTILSAFLLLFEMEAIMFALAPSLVFDVLRVHLPAVQYYAEQHALRVPAYLPYAYFPQSVETVMTLGYVFAGQAAAQLFPALYFVLALLTLFRIGRICGMDRFCAIAGLLFTISIPAIHWTGSSGKNDFALVFFILTAVLCFLRWMERQFFRWIVLGTFFVAMGAGVKHIVLFALPPMALLYAYAAWRQPRRVLALSQLAAVFLVFGVGWQTRTWLATGNPLYPSPAVSAVSAGIGHPHEFWRGVVLPYVQLPWALHFRGHVYFESVSDYPMGMVLIFFAPVWLLVRKRLTKATRVCLLFCGLYLMYWAFAIPVIRYGIAPIAIVLLLTAGLLGNFCRAMPPMVGASVLAACAYVFVFAGCGIAINEINGPQLRYFSRRTDRREYLREALAPARSLEYLKSAVKPGDSIFSVDSCALAYAPNEDRFDCILLESGTWKEALAALSRHSYRFLMAPQGHVADVPSGWIVVYRDAGYNVYRR